MTKRSSPLPTLFTLSLIALSMAACRDRSETAHERAPHAPSDPGAGSAEPRHDVATDEDTAEQNADHDPETAEDLGEREHAVLWLSPCIAHDDCRNVAACTDGFCFHESFTEQTCDRSHRACDGAIGLECDRYGVPGDLFRCANGTVCNPDPIGERCVPTRCLRNGRFCDGDRHAARCNALGTDASSIACPDSMLCRDGTCIAPVHAPSGRTCVHNNDRTLRLSANTDGTRLTVDSCAFVSPPKPTDLLACEDGNCTIRGCLPGASRCVSDDRVQLCDSDATWKPSERCDPEQRCVAGVCLEANCEKVASPARCMQNTLIRCENGAWKTDECPFGCDSVPTAACRTPSCEPGQSHCAGDEALTLCDWDGQLVPVACPAGSRCHDSECVQALCEPHERRCNGASVEVCLADGSAFERHATCAVNERCVDSTCVAVAASEASAHPFRVVCRVADSDRLHTEIELRANFPLVCALEPDSNNDNAGAAYSAIEWSFYTLDARGALEPTDVLEAQRIAPDRIRLTAPSNKSAQRFRVAAAIRRKDGSEAYAFADARFLPTAPLIVRLIYKSELSGLDQQIDDTNLNLMLKPTDAAWTSPETMLSAGLMTAARFEGVGAIVLERYSDRPGSLEYAVFEDTGRHGRVDLAVRYWSGIFAATPRIEVFLGHRKVSEIHGPRMHAGRAYEDGTRAGPTWLVGTLDTETGHIRKDDTLYEEPETTQ